MHVVDAAFLFVEVIGIAGTWFPPDSIGVEAIPEGSLQIVRVCSIWDYPLSDDAKVESRTVDLSDHDVQVDLHELERAVVDAYVLRRFRSAPKDRVLHSKFARVTKCDSRLQFSIVVDTQIENRTKFAEQYVADVICLCRRGLSDVFAAAADGIGFMSTLYEFNDNRINRMNHHSIERIKHFYRDQLKAHNDVRTSLLLDNDTRRRNFLDKLEVMERLKTRR